MSIERRPVVDDPGFFKLEVESVVQGFQAIIERPNLLDRADTPEARELSALLQAKRRKEEPWTIKDYCEICQIIFPPNIDPVDFSQLRRDLQRERSVNFPPDLWIALENYHQIVVRKYFISDVPKVSLYGLAKPTGALPGQGQKLGY